MAWIKVIVKLIIEKHSIFRFLDFYIDWIIDLKFISYVIQGSDYVRKYEQVKSEMKALLLLFAFEHFILCSPMFILSYNIHLRNIYLDTLYGQLPEEQVIFAIL